MKYILLAIFSLSMIFTACKDESTPTDAAKEKTEEDEPVFEEEDLEDLYETDGKSDKVVTEEEYDDRENTDKAAYDDGDDDVFEDVRKDVTESNPTTTTQRSAERNIDSGGKYLVVAGSFKVKENAEALLKNLNKLGINDAELVYFNAREYHTVGAGYFDSLSDAKARVKMLKDNGMEGYVHAR